MNLQSIENWLLYYVLKDPTNVNNIKMYRCVSKLNTNITKQAELDKQNTEDLTL